jgi:hypothetical protein
VTALPFRILLALFRHPALAVSQIGLNDSGKLFCGAASGKHRVNDGG